jgi:hypothetical protein
MCRHNARYVQIYRPWASILLSCDTQWCIICYSQIPMFRKNFLTLSLVWKILLHTTIWIVKEDKKINFPIQQAIKAKRGKQTYSCTLSLTSVLDWSVWSTPRPICFTPLYRSLGGVQGRCGRVRKLSPPARFDSRTFQPVAIQDHLYSTFHNDCV